MEFRKLKKTAAILSLTGILCAGSTIAYMTAFTFKINQIAVGHNETTIVEDFPDPGEQLISDDPEYKKVVSVQNASYGESGFDVECYVRISLSYSNSDIGRAVRLTGLNTVDWIYHADDGFYYYRKILKEGEKTVPLFTGFSVDSSKVDSVYQAYLDDFSIEVYEESVQAEGFSDYQSAWSYYTHPVSQA